MSFTAYKCSGCGLVHFDKVPCCGVPLIPYEAGLPLLKKGAPNVVPDKLPKYHDWALGEDISSRSVRNRRYKEEGLRQKSFRDMPSEERERIKHSTTIYSYEGQTKHGTPKDIREREGR